MGSINRFSFNGNPKLKKPGAIVEFTKEQVEEYLKCSQDPVYFIEKYVRVIHVDRGPITMEMRPYTKDTIENIHNNRYSITMMARQSGKTATISAYILHYVLFNEAKNCVIVANKASTAKMIMSRIQYAYENLPMWLQQGVTEWNKTSISLENESAITCYATSSSGARGSSVSLLYWDEVGLVPNNIAEDFWVSIYPTVSSGTETKVILSSTPFGYNLFWKLWTEAERGINGFSHHKVNWWEVAGRDQAWYNEQLRVLGPVKTAQEVDCSFEGSSHTLISSKSIAALPTAIPITENDTLKVFEEPIKDHSYVGIVDTARGTENDYSVVTIIDVTSLPYKVTATYRDNNISPYAFPQVVHRMVNSYNQAYALIENNDSGGQVADTMYQDFEYENMFYTSGKELKEGSNKMTTGVKTTSKVKRLGASAIKTIIENGHLLVNDAQIITEMSVFVSKRGSYAADTGDYNDDLMMCLLLFGWLTQQKLFKDLTNMDTRVKLFDKQSKEIDDMMLPFGFMTDGVSEMNTTTPNIVNGKWVPSDNFEESKWLL